MPLKNLLLETCVCIKRANKSKKNIYLQKNHFFWFLMCILAIISISIFIFLITMKCIIRNYSSLISFYSSIKFYKQKYKFMAKLHFM